MMAKKKEIIRKPYDNKCLNVSITECWKCKKKMTISYYSDDQTMPYGPENFTEKQIAYAKEYGCKIEKSYSEAGIAWGSHYYIANKCPHCNAIMGQFFYHDWAYVPGDIQLFLDDDDNIINKVINLQIEEIIIEPELANKIYEQIVKVRFGVGKSYEYEYVGNCQIIVGNKVKVTGKLEGQIGEIESVNDFRVIRNAQKVVEIIS